MQAVVPLSVTQLHSDHWPFMSSMRSQIGLIEVGEKSSQLKGWFDEDRWKYDCIEIAESRE